MLDSGRISPGIGSDEQLELGPDPREPEHSAWSWGHRDSFLGAGIGAGAVCMLSWVPKQLTGV